MEAWAEVASHPNERNEPRVSHRTREALPILRKDKDVPTSDQAVARPLAGVDWDAVLPRELSTGSMIGRASRSRRMATS